MADFEFGVALSRFCTRGKLKLTYGRDTEDAEGDRGLDERKMWVRFRSTCSAYERKDPDVTKRKVTLTKDSNCVGGGGSNSNPPTKRRNNGNSYPRRPGIATLVLESFNGQGRLNFNTSPARERSEYGREETNYNTAWPRWMKLNESERRKQELRVPKLNGIVLNQVSPREIPITSTRCEARVPEYQGTPPVDAHRPNDARDETAVRRWGEESKAEAALASKKVQERGRGRGRVGGCGVVGAGLASSPKLERRHGWSEKLS
ncbi:hypothetical protein B0H16DRAFT_1696590 [Mycena metata]|uniref:Uncharacterized protein n=1 Tax=Mycena metata TaxID=1033252 RepID=A0AAD7MSW5_9AGAR|nr:hypothetical protein B0H16DRAFT_1696590 [Mycena metata]